MGPKVSGLAYKSRAKWYTLQGIYSAIYGEVNVSICVEIKGEYRAIQEESAILWEMIVQGCSLSPSGTSELDCATTKTDTAERSISIGTESVKVFFCTRGLGVLAGSTARG